MTELFLFYKNSPFSQFYLSKFCGKSKVVPTEEKELIFSTAEHWLHYYKAILFGDKEIAIKILEAKNPYEAKILGRKVSNYNEKIWNEKRVSIAIEGNILKFSQNPTLLKALLDTNDKILVEASPTDTIWGIGLSITDPKAYKPTEWNGQNLLGKVLNETKKLLRK